MQNDKILRSRQEEACGGDLTLRGGEACVGETTVHSRDMEVPAKQLCMPPREGGL